jgi:transcription elongation GreA/GreB family factor
MFFTPMEAEIQKAVDAGKLSKQAGAALGTLSPGSYCTHKSWGFGQVEALNFLVSQITVNFRGKKGHTMQLQYAAESLRAIPTDHILVQIATNLDGVKKRAKEDAVGLVRSILGSHQGRATQDEIAQLLVPDVFSEAEFKRWWDSAKKALKKDGHFAIPSKKSEPIELREEAVSHADELLAAFAGARKLKEQLAILEKISRSVGDFSNPAKQLQPVISAVEAAAQKNLRLNTSQAFELILARDEICEKVPALKAGENAITLEKMVRDEDRRLVEILPDIPAAKQKRVLAELPKAIGDQWAARALQLMQRSNTRIVSEIAHLLQEQGKHEDLRKELDRWISEHSITPEILFWLCKERDGVFGDLVQPQVLSAILTALERDQFNDVKRGGKIHDLLLDDRELIPDLLAGAEPEAVRDVMRKLMLTPVFEELNKRSLMGRIIRIHPEIQAMLTGEATADKQEALVVSWESLEKRKVEYEELINKKIPENTKEISLARSYGDLRENFEFKAAKEMQRVLMRRKSEMEQALSRARGTNFENPDTTQVSIGSTVTLKNSEPGVTETYSILGAWDSDPANGIISYLTAIGQALLGHKVGDELDLPTEHGTEKVEITSISAYRAAETAANLI